MAHRFAGSTRDGVRRVWANRAVFADARSWLVSARSAACIAYPAAPVPGRGRIETVRTRDGERYAVRVGQSDLSVLYELIRQNEYDAAVHSVANPGDVRWVVDMGSNVGMSLRLWLRAFPRARVIGVEPDADNNAMCRMNLSFIPGGAERTTLVRACVGGVRRTVALDRRSGAWGYRMADSATPVGSDSVPVVTVEDVLERVDGVVDLLKMDIEGAEAEVFARPAPWLSRVRRMVIETHSPFTEELLRQAIARGPGDWRLRRLRASVAATVVEAVNTELDGAAPPAPPLVP